jgi:chromosome segregation protein
VRLRSEQAAEQLASIDLELEELVAAEEAQQAKLGAARQVLAELLAERERLVGIRDQTAQRAADLRAERSGLLSRIDVLQGLERTHEGLGTGPREVYALLERPDPGRWKTVVGLLAEFLTVRREFAPLIDLALGDRAQRFLVRDSDELALALGQHGQPFSGRVSFLPLPAPRPNPAVPPTGGAALVSSRPTSPAAGAPALRGVVALAENVVRCDDPRFADLPGRLLGQTLIVRDLATARAIAAIDAGYRCITLQGELLEADGTLTVGTHHAEAGILSRKSELRELREQVTALDRRLAELEQDLVGLRERLAVLDNRAEHAQREINVLAEQASDMHWRISQHRQRRAGLHEEVSVSREEISGLEQDLGRLTADWQRALAQANEAEAEVQSSHARVVAAEGEIRARDAQRQQQQQDALAARVALAQVEERLSGLRARQEQLEADLRQRDGERAGTARRLDALRARLEECESTLLQASMALAAGHLRKELAEANLGNYRQERSGKHRERQELAEQAQASRSTWRAQQDQAHARELAANDLRHHLEALSARLREDYQLDLAELHRSAGAADQGTPDSCPPSPAAEEEIVELRRKLSKLGHVNLEAIQELADLETRHEHLQTQFDDLTSGQRVLQDIISRINTDSRRLFTETFGAIRGNFQELFRKLFGGGMADVLLEEGVDILESGIEVMARPPGKELRNISLMSGGEKTMTAVALLLAIFRSKPSPFCILDEVDAALDEANVGRFTSVLRDFLDRSQFIIITHSKRTMACADVLYGLTMQESGISRRFAVRFEDWPDEDESKEPAA